jgi:RNA-directed DNA polymerase
MKKDFPYDLIQNNFYTMESTSDFIQLLNDIKKKFFSNSFETDVEQSEDLKPITINRIKFYLSKLKKDNDGTENNLYQISEIPKKTGGYRKVHSPNADLKIVLKCIDILLRSVYIPHPNSFAFIENKNIVDNAKMHTNKRYVYNVDLKDFFYSFNYNRIKTTLYKEPFNLSSTKEKEEIAYWISILTTCKINGDQVLPQGSPASPVLSNIICRRLDDKLNRLAHEFSLNYSRYADDITFSSDQQVFHGKFIKKLNKIIQNEGFTVNESKIRLQNQGERQVVTGITVNKGTNVSRAYIKELRMYIYYIEKYGLQKAFGYFLNDIKTKHINTSLSPEKINETYFQNTLKGKLNFLAMVRGKSDPLYSNLANRYNELFQNNTTSFIEKIAIICKIGNINIARRIYDERIKDRNYKITSSFSLNDADFYDFSVSSDSDVGLDNTRDKELSEVHQLIQDQAKDKKELSELQLNINFLKQILAMKDISALGRHHILEAFSEYFNTSKADSVKTEEKFKAIHDPKRLVELLNMFGSNQRELKFVTHIWDGDDISSFIMFKEKIFKYYPEFKEMKHLDKNLWMEKIFPFVFQQKQYEKKDKGEVIPYFWGKHRIKIGWNYPNFIMNWCAENFDNKGIKASQPFNIVLPEEFIPEESRVIDKITIKTFMDLVNVFKKEIEFRGNDFYISIQYRFADILTGFELDKSSLKSLKSFSVYTNTEKILEAIDRVFKMIKNVVDDKSRNGTKLSKLIRIRSVFHETQEEKFYTLEIIHVNSVCDKPQNHPKLSGKTGDLANVVKKLTGRCDFSILGEFSDGTKRVFANLDYLYSGCDHPNSDVRITTNVDDPGGFVYWFKFYV